MAKRPTLKDFKNIAVKDKNFVVEYEALRPEFEIVRNFIKARLDSSCSQQELANRLQLQQPAIARLERGGYATTSVAKLNKVANALGYSLKFHLHPKKRGGNNKKS